MFLILDLQHIYYRYWYTRDKFDEIISKTGRNVAHVKATYNECLNIIADFEFHYDETDAAICICLDRESSKKVAYPEYKANRKSRLDDENRAEIEYIARTLGKKGATIYAEHGFEADDIIHTLTQEYPDEDMAIYTSDMDLLMHVKDNVDVWIRRKGEYVCVRAKRFEHNVEFLGKRKIAVFNDTVLYKSTVGDASDNIKGIKGFGDKAYEKKMELLLSAEPDIKVPTDPDGVRAFTEKYMGFTSKQMEEFEIALGMVSPLICKGLEKPKAVSILPIIQEVRK